MAMKSCCANCGENLVLVLPPLLGDALAKLAKRTSRALENGFGFYLWGTKNMSWHKERDDPVPYASN
jgi:hypothetical protein